MNYNNFGQITLTVAVMGPLGRILGYRCKGHDTVGRYFEGPVEETEQGARAEFYKEACRR